MIMATHGPGLRPYYLRRLRYIATRTHIVERARRAAAAASLLARDAKGLIDLDMMPREREMVMDASRDAEVWSPAPVPRHWDGTSPAPGTKPTAGPFYPLLEMRLTTRRGRAAHNHHVARMATLVPGPVRFLYTDPWPLVSSNIVALTFAVDSSSTFLTNSPLIGDVL